MRHAIRTRSTAVGLALLLVVGLAGVGLAGVSLSGCGYSLAGRGSSLPSTIQTVGIPLFTNQTPIFELEQVLTERVRLEFISRGRYKVQPDTPGVDAVLAGEIVSVTITPTAFNANQQATRYSFTMVVKVEFRDIKANRVLYENPALQFREEYEIAAATTGTGGVPDAGAFLGQNADAKDRMANDFARSVVSSILEAF